MNEQKRKLNYTNNWNFIDKTIYKLEIFVDKAIFYIKENKEMPEPEDMILAATRHLQEENDRLKEYAVPAKVIFVNEEYQCPKCKVMIASELIEKYRIRHCPECGKRLFRVNKSEKSTSKISVEANESELL